MKIIYRMLMLAGLSLMFSPNCLAEDPPPVPLPCAPADCPPIDPCKLAPERCKDEGGPIESKEETSASEQAD
jgi:hypothetical protein